MRCYFAFLIIDMFVFFTRYSLRYFSLKLDMKLSARPSKADEGYRSLSEAI